MQGYEPGMLVKSKAGHDKDELFVIINIEEEYVYLVDGKYKTLQSPKKKNKKHIQYINYSDENLVSKLKGTNKVIDEDIKRAIKLYLLNSNML
ncbi:KOW domain-containing RNA-binding protein [Anaeromicropila herbilytica]|uniref:RNA-binding protein n=1 Tax=Anaeromicropila herbilytica TaxID=2785025 RepID=A0A7R7EPN5_9FIRM|nr:KOW domain-containing RNA-binding protein [Anaeromicropila herbilytica]BCN32741.1 hypothetical protein bsdtb5_40360 [Anaeromicropila herbilytica]